MPEQETGPITVQIAPCGVCDALFLLSGRRPTSPCHGADPLVALATLVVGLDGAVSGDWGSLLAPTAHPGSVEGPVAPTAPGPEDEEEGEEEEAQALASPRERLLAQAFYFLQDSELDGTDLRNALLDAGAEMEDTATAVGRLDAVRGLLRQLIANSPDLPP